MASRASLQCTIHPFGTLPNLKYVVVCSFYEGKYMLSRHKKRDTWETQGGHIDSGESPLEAAKRELFEESGVKDADLFPVCDYFGYDADSSSDGTVFLAVIHQLGTMPDSEMKEIGTFDVLPENLTYPNVSPKLFAEAKILNDRITRITAMEAHLDHVSAVIKALDEALQAYTEIRPALNELVAYYESPVWRADYEADEHGEIPKELKRGVLSEDAVYNLLTDHVRLLDQINEIEKK